MNLKIFPASLNPTIIEESLSWVMQLEYLFLNDIPSLDEAYHLPVLSFAEKQATP
ncbi:MAG: hypothetical protein IPO21_15265 [Bacteroidales bacterium]|nr:hypothetical protein [Bacteroidales bacterium]